MNRLQLRVLAIFAPLAILAGLLAGWGADAWACWQPQPWQPPTIHVVIDSHHLEYHGTERQLRPGREGR